MVRFANLPMVTEQHVLALALQSFMSKSSSQTDTQTVAVLPSKLVCEDVALSVTVTDSSTLSASFSPVTLTVCAVFQFEVVKVRVALFTVATPVSLELTDTVTSAVG